MNTTKLPLGNLIGGIILIFIGIFFLLDMAGLIAGIEDLWPLFMILVGIVFLLGYFFKRDNHGILFVGLLVFLNGVFFLLWNLGHTGMYDMHELWPIFLLIPGVSFILMALASKEERKALIPGLILIIMGTIFFLSTVGDIDTKIWRFMIKLWPIILILIGAKLLLQYRKSGNNQNI